jgi:hypothetical protein
MVSFSIFEQIIKEPHRKMIKKAIAFLVLLFIIPQFSFTQVKIIFDTDFGGDADDLGALSLLHNLKNEDECKVLGIMSWSTEKYVIPALDALNKYYGNPDIPLGIRSKEVHYTDWNYNRIIAENFENTLSNEEVPLAKDLYREILAREEDKSIILVTVGPLKNIEDLLLSEPDQYSELDGNQLFHKKIKKMIIMGGKFPEGENEWNFDGGMSGVTKFVLENVELPIIFSGYEVGIQIKTGEVFNRIKHNHPLYLGYYHFSKNAPWMKEYFKGSILDNSTYDQTAVLYAVRGGEGIFWEKINNGYCQVNEKGDNKWIFGEPGNQSYLVLKKDPEEMAALIEDLMLGKMN